MHLIHRIRVAARLAYNQTPASADDLQAIRGGVPGTSVDPPRPMVLHYALGPRWWQRAAARRYAGLVPLLPLAIVGWQFGPDTCAWAQKKYWQRECLRFNPPSTTVVYERHAAGAPVPPTPPHYSGTVANLPLLMRSQIAGTSKPSFEMNCIAICWARYQSLLSRAAGRSAGSMVFCHQLSNARGDERLVEVEMLRLDSTGFNLAEDMIGMAFDLSKGTGVSNQPMFGGGGAVPPYLPFPQRIYAGQLDSSDSSHLTIEYVWPDGVHGFLDGYLHDDDDVVIVVRSGPGDVKSATAAFRKNPAAWVDR
jgi:hypothetical protein